MENKKGHQITCMIQLELSQTIFQRTKQIWQVFLHLTIDQGLFSVLVFINFYRALRAKKLSPNYLYDPWNFHKLFFKGLAKFGKYSCI